jgi:hypothetical protein
MLDTEESRFVKFLAISFVGGFGATLAIIAVVFASGATFGQRCERAYRDPVHVEDCVVRLSAGGRVYPEASP